MQLQLAALVSDIDVLIGRQLDQILHHLSFQALEAGWRGLALLCAHTPQASHCTLRILDIDVCELQRECDGASAIEQSTLFHLIYDHEFDHAGGEPYGLLLGNFAFNPAHPPHQRMLRFLAEIAQSAFSPFIASVHPQFFGLNRFSDLEFLDIEKNLSLTPSQPYVRLRTLGSSRFLSLLLPHILLREPWRTEDSTKLLYRERCDANDSLLWGNAVFALGSIIVREFACSGWFTRIAGHDSDRDHGGTLSPLARAQTRTPSWCFAPLPDVDAIISDRVERDLTALGFASFCHDWNTQHASFFSLPTLHYGEKHERPCFSGLQQMLCVCRIAHYIKQMMRDRIGSLKSTSECAQLIQTWLLRYTAAATSSTAENIARYPLRQARVDVYDDLSTPGRYLCHIHLVPHLSRADAVAEISLATHLST